LIGSNRPTTNNIKSLRIGLASPEKIISWSHGEVKKPETFNYRTYKPEKDGLFCERIFGPVKDYECACGKYKKKRYKNLVCERCGVEVTSNRARRERLGHIRLASPVAHIWFTKSIPNRFSALLGISGKEIEKVIYFVSYLVIGIDEEWILKKLPEISKLVHDRLNELQQRNIKARELVRLNLFDVTIEAELTAAQKKEFKALASGLKDAAAGDITDEQEKSLEEVKNVLLKQGLLKQHMLAEPLRDEETGELIAYTRELPDYAVLSKALYLGKFDIAFEMRDEERDITIKKEIEEIQNEQINLTEALMLLENIKPLDRLNDVQKDQYNYLKMLCLDGDMGDLDEHINIGIGASAIQETLRSMDFPALEAILVDDLDGATSQKKQKLIKRLKVCRAFLHSKNRPEWMILTVLPVLPPELRPMVELEGGRFASSDLNDLYRRVINRNNRLKKLIDIRAPESILRNERRMLQESVDALIDNGRKGRAAVNVNNRALKSLSDMLKGKQGRFRQNLLGKRVDYSGRSVIVVGPKLKLHQCGLPKYMALELFKPFVLNKLINPDDPNQNIAQARRTLERAEDPRVWDALEEITRSHPVLLNRAPTLHRLSIQAFEPVLIEGKAIQLHPLVCAAYNADFDGDQMAVHVPLSTAAQAEARILMLSANNLMLPADGAPVIAPSHDIVLGIYYLTVATSEDKYDIKKVPYFYSQNDALMAYQNGHIKMQDLIQLPIHRSVTRDTELSDPKIEADAMTVTTVGRIIFNKNLADVLTLDAATGDYPLPYINAVVDKGCMSSIISEAFQICGQATTVKIADALKDLGFEMATQSGLTIAASDIVIPIEKEKILAAAENQAQDIWSKRKSGVITETEKDLEVTRIWDQATKDLTKAMRNNFSKLNSVYMMATSGARGKIDQVRQLAAMRGLLVGPSGRVLDFPIKSNFREGLSVSEYFISTHGGRKGLVDTALKTADSGYLTRRLIDVALDVSVTEEECGTDEFITLDLSLADSIRKYKKILVGRVIAENVIDPETGETVIESGTEINNARATVIFRLGVKAIAARSALTCRTLGGVCSRCYGWDLASGQIAQVGDPIGVVAAQSIGEPGTQLTMRTFHTGGIKSSADITQGLPLVEQIFEVRGVKNASLLSEQDGEVVNINEMVYERVTVQSNDGSREKTYEVVHPYHDRLKIHFRSKIAQGDALDNAEEIFSDFPGIVTQLFSDTAKTYWKITIRDSEGNDHDYETPHENRSPRVAVGQFVRRGDELCEGNMDLRRYHQLMGDLATQLFITNKIQEIYESQNVNTNSKHIEVVAKQMVRFVEVTDPAKQDEFYEGDLIDRNYFQQLCEGLEAEGKPVPQGRSLLQGISKSSLSTESFLAAASFQETTRVLTEAAIEGKIDLLKGLKENVIIGGLIPVGTGKVYQDIEKGVRAAIFPDGPPEGEDSKDEGEATVESIF
jgi:DNA-directed RNA polymerase subunit beta'